MVRTLLSDHTRLAAGAIVGAVTAALFAEGLIAGPPKESGDRIAITQGASSAPEPVPAVAGSQPLIATATPTSTTTTTTTTSTTTTTTTKRPSPTTTTTTTTVPPTTTT